ncbi:MAG: alkaline phosphatase PhoX, partial [Acetobacteraceae bacterium]
MPSRRAFLAATATAALAAAPGAGQAWAAGAVTASSLDLAPLDPRPLLDDRVGPGLVRSVLLRWGDAVLAAAPAFTPDHPSVEAAGQQFGWDGVVAGITVPPPAGDGIARLVATIAHPWPEPAMAFPDGAAHPAIAARMQGASVLNLQFTGGRWLVVAGGYQMRRLDDTTLCRLTGPAAGAVGNVVQGLLAPSGGSATPWGTVLLGEDAVAPHLAALAGVEKRFAAAGMAARFGWVTEIDPLDPFNIPAKRTALGRFPHAGIAAGRSADGRAVVFLAIDQPDGGLLRRWPRGGRAPMTPCSIAARLRSLASRGGSWCGRRWTGRCRAWSARSMRSPLPGARGSIIPPGSRSRPAERCFSPAA